MASNLYETLELDYDATPEQIRKAYRKKALETHPDRFATKTAAEKSLAEEQFRLVNNAYEVLTDPEKRQLYDLHGVYPPPAYSDPPQPRRGGRRYTSQPHHPDPFFDFEANFSSIPGMRRHTSTRNAPHHHPEYNAFTDPFELFNSMFGDMHRQFNDPFDPFSPFTRAHRNPQEGSRGRARQDPYETPNMFNPGPTSFPFTGGFDPFGGMPNNGFTGSPPRESRDSRRGGGRVYRHESRTTVTRNGITQSTWKRIEEDGTTHVTHTFPDGREENWINGVLQKDNPPPHRSINVGPDGYPPPPLITGSPAHSRHHSRNYEGPYNSAAVRPESWNDDLGYNHASERKRRWWHTGWR